MTAGVAILALIAFLWSAAALLLVVSKGREIDNVIRILERTPHDQDGDLLP